MSLFHSRVLFPSLPANGCELVLDGEVLDGDQGSLGGCRQVEVH